MAVDCSAYARRSDYGAAHAVDIARHDAEIGCRDLLGRMLYAGQHRWTFGEAMEIAANLGLDRWRVKAGFAL